MSDEHPADAATDGGAWPTVSVVVATRDRPQLLAQALASIVAQSYPGVVQSVLVFDQSTPDLNLVSADPRRPVVVIGNDHTPGLAGARNSGVVASNGTLLAFCDDDDEWLPTKLERQMETLNAQHADVVVCGIHVHYEGKIRTRVPAPEDVTLTQLIRRRVMEAHPSTVLVTRAAFEGPIGPVDEEIPGSYAEDYDWILRAAERATIATLPEPLVHVLWHRGSFFSQRWRTIIEALDYCLDKHPAFAADPRGLARILGQQSVAYAALGERKAAWTKVRATLRSNPREPRAYIALLVASRLVGIQTVVHVLNRIGRGV